MAVTFSTFLDTARKAKECAGDLKLVRSKLRDLIDHHNANGFSTAGDASKPAYVNEDVNLNIDTLNFSRQDYLAMANLANQIEAFFTDGTPAQGDYRVTVEKIANA